MPELEEDLLLALVGVTRTPLLLALMVDERKAGMREPRGVGDG
jgi:hypothetical protein